MNRPILLLLVVLAVSSCAPAAIKNLDETSSGDRLSVSDRSFQVEVAKSESEHVKGLSGRSQLKDDAGMLFIFPDEQVRYFWMKDMLFPLDIVFIDKEGKIVDIKRDFQPCAPDACPSYSSAAPAKYVLEVDAGSMEGIEPEAKVYLN